MRITGKHLQVDLSDEGIELERIVDHGYLHLSPDEGHELIVFLEMIKTGSNIIVMHKHEESESDSGQGYM